MFSQSKIVGESSTLFIGLSIVNESHMLKNTIYFKTESVHNRLRCKIHTWTRISKILTSKFQYGLKQSSVKPTVSSIHVNLICNDFIQRQYHSHVIVLDAVFLVSFFVVIIYILVKRSGTVRRLQILRGGFNSRLEPIAFDICASGCRLVHNPIYSVTVDFSFNIL